MMLNSKTLAALEQDLPLEPRPFRSLAQAAGTTEDDLLKALRVAIKDQVVRRYGVIVRHQPLGYHANAMVVWQVPEERVEEVGRQFAARDEVSHCYQRPPFADFPYNLYTMIHARSREECEDIARRMSEVSSVSDCQLLFSVREFKKTSPIYSGSEEATE